MLFYQSKVFFFVALPSHIVRIMSAYRELRDTDSALALCMHVIFSLCSVFSFHYQHSAICVQQHDIFFACYLLFLHSMSVIRDVINIGYDITNNQQSND